MDEGKKFNQPGVNEENNSLRHDPVATKRLQQLGALGPKFPLYILNIRQVEVSSLGWLG